MPVLLILLLAVVAEVVVLVTVGDLVGVLPTLGLLVLATLVGAWLLRREGTRALAAFTEAVRTRRPPHRELADGVLIAAAGVLVVLPGFLSDVVAILLLLPPTRALVRRRLVRSASRSTPLRFTPGGVVDGGVVDGGVAPDRPAPGPAIPPRPEDHRS
ncbi:MAG: FxsA family protein [Pseudonocardiaceae bacterium]